MCHSGGGVWRVDVRPGSLPLDALVGGSLGRRFSVPLHPPGIVPGRLQHV